VTAGRRSPKLTSVAVALPRGLWFSARRLTGHVLIGGRKPHERLTVSHRVLTIRLKRGARRIAVTVATPGLSATRTLAREVRRRRAGRGTVTLKLHDAARNASTLKLRLRLS